MKAPSFIFYWRRLSSTEKRALSNACNVSGNYFSQVAGGHKGPSDEVVRKMVEHDSQIQQVWFL